MEVIRIKNWRTFQHYQHRRPPWIKLHRDILNNYDFYTMSLASRALAPYLWLLASEYENGEIPLDFSMLASRLRFRRDTLKVCINELVLKGFILTSSYASNMLAPCKQEARLEVELEVETEKEKPRPQTARPAISSMSDLKKNLRVKTLTPQQERYSVVAKLRNEALRLYVEGLSIPDVKEILKDWAASNGIPYDSAVVCAALDLAEAAQRAREA